MTNRCRNEDRKPLFGTQVGLGTFSFSTNVYRSDAFENPALQQHFRNLEALALDMMAPEEVEDLISKIQTSVPGCLSSVTSPLLVFLFHHRLSAKGGAD